MSKVFAVTIGVFLCVLVLNAAYVIYISPAKFSPLYCIGGDVIGPMWNLWAEFLFVACVVMFGVGLFFSRTLAIGCVFLMGLVSSAPEYARILTLGGVCQ